jgi:hypothetical protein
MLDIRFEGAKLSVFYENERAKALRLCLPLRIPCLKAGAISV